MNSPADLDHPIRTAGAVTIIAGVLVAALPAVWVIILQITRGIADAPPDAVLVGLLLTGAVFVLLGWGVLRRIRLCAAAAGVLAATPLVLQMLGIVKGGVFFPILSLFVLGANWFAWREIGRLADESPAEPVNRA
jgi:hypothetical protein